MSVFTGTRYTVRMRVFVPIPVVTSADGWTWAALPEGDPVGYEYAYSGTEVVWALRDWGCAVARVLIRARHDRFALLASSVETGAALGRTQWHRSPETGLLRPVGEPWCVDTAMTIREPAGATVPA